MPGQEGQGGLTPSLGSSSGAWNWGGGGAYLGLADGAVQGIVLLVIEQAEVQSAQGSCRQKRAQVTHWLLPEGMASFYVWLEESHFFKRFRKISTGQRHSS
jgi:hypothetical protein